MNKIVFFDFDGTLTVSNSWYLFNTQFGITKEEDTALFERYLKTNFSYREWMDEIVALLKSRGSCTQEAVETFARTIVLRDDAKETLQACKDAGYIVVVISGGLRQVVETALEGLPIDHICTTAELVFDAEGNFTSIIDQSDEMHAKVEAFINLCAQYQIDEQDAVVVGDGGNDLEIFKRSKKAIQIGNYEPLKEYAWKHIESLSEIKEFV